MRFGIIPPVRMGVTADPRWMTWFARHAEACGFESFYLPEHVALYPGASVGASRSTPPYHV